MKNKFFTKLLMAAMLFICTTKTNEVQAQVVITDIKYDIVARNPSAPTLDAFKKDPTTDISWYEHIQFVMKNQLSYMQKIVADRKLYLEAAMYSYNQHWRIMGHSGPITSLDTMEAILAKGNPVIEENFPANQMLVEAINVAKAKIQVFYNPAYNKVELIELTGPSGYKIYISKYSGVGKECCINLVIDLHPRKPLPKEIQLKHDTITKYITQKEIIHDTKVIYERAAQQYGLNFIFEMRIGAQLCYAMPMQCYQQYYPQQCCQPRYIIPCGNQQVVAVPVNQTTINNITNITNITNNNITNINNINITINHYEVTQTERPTEPRDSTNTGGGGDPVTATDNHNDTGGGDHPDPVTPTDSTITGGGGDGFENTGGAGKKEKKKNKAKQEADPSDESGWVATDLQAQAETVRSSYTGSPQPEPASYVDDAGSYNGPSDFSANNIETARYGDYAPTLEQQQAEAAQSVNRNYSDAAAAYNPYDYNNGYNPGYTGYNPNPNNFQQPLNGNFQNPNYGNTNPNNGFQPYNNSGQTQRSFADSYFANQNNTFRNNGNNGGQTTNSFTQQGFTQTQRPVMQNPQPQPIQQMQMQRQPAQQQTMPMQQQRGGGGPLR